MEKTSTDRPARSGPLLHQTPGAYASPGRQEPSSLLPRPERDVIDLMMRVWSLPASRRPRPAFLSILFYAVYSQIKEVPLPSPALGRLGSLLIAGGFYPIGALGEDVLRRAFCAELIQKTNLIADELTRLSAIPALSSVLSLPELFHLPKTALLTPEEYSAKILNLSRPLSDISRALLSEDDLDRLFCLLMHRKGDFFYHPSMGWLTAGPDTPGSEKDGVRGCRLEPVTAARMAFFARGVCRSLKIPSSSRHLEMFRRICESRAIPQDHRTIALRIPCSRIIPLNPAGNSPIGMIICTVRGIAPPRALWVLGAHGATLFDLLQVSLPEITVVVDSGKLLKSQIPNHQFFGKRLLLCKIKPSLRGPSRTFRRIISDLLGAGALPLHIRIGKNRTIPWTPGAFLPVLFTHPNPFVGPLGNKNKRDLESLFTFFEPEKKDIKEIEKILRDRSACGE